MDGNLFHLVLEDYKEAKIVLLIKINFVTKSKVVIFKAMVKNAIRDKI